MAPHALQKFSSALSYLFLQVSVKSLLVSGFGMSRWTLQLYGVTSAWFEATAEL